MSTEDKHPRYWIKIDGCLLWIIVVTSLIGIYKICELFLTQPK